MLKKHEHKSRKTFKETQHLQIKNKTKVIQTIVRGYDVVEIIIKICHKKRCKNTSERILWNMPTIASDSLIIPVINTIQEEGKEDRERVKAKRIV